MKVAYVDASSGVAGDMFLAALVDAGGSPTAVNSALAALGIDGLRVAFTPVRRAGLSALAASVTSNERGEIARTGVEVLSLIGHAGLAEPVKNCAEAAFGYLIDAEAKAHGVHSDDVHLHEIGAADSIADIVGTAALLDELGLLRSDSRIICSGIAAGSGTVSCAHGRLPVPVPAVLNVLTGSELRLDFSGLAGERTTPTGAAILRAVAEGGQPPPMRLISVGSGAGSRDTPDRPNVTRIVIGEADPLASTISPDDVELIECTVDDLDPQFVSQALDAVRHAGALDCWTTRITGRHGRGGEVVAALVSPSSRSAVIDAIFTHTGTFGVRSSVWRRETLDRTTRVLNLPGAATIDVKLGTRGGRVVAAKPEPSQIAELARATGRPVRLIRDQIAVELRRQFPELTGD